MLHLLVYVFLLLFILVFFGSAVYAGFRASPWLPVFKKDIERILKLADLKKGEVVYDLGSGDGRILIALANNSPAKLIVGYEVSLILNLWSKARLWFLRLGKRVEVRFDDFLLRDLTCANVVFCFLTPMAMKKLAPKFKKELKPGTRIISYSFALPNWEAEVIDKPKENDMPIFKYRIS